MTMLLPRCMLPGQNIRSRFSSAPFGTIASFQSHIVSAIVWTLKAIFDA